MRVDGFVFFVCFVETGSLYYVTLAVLELAR